MKRNQVAQRSFGVWILNDSREDAWAEWEPYEMGYTRARAMAELAKVRKRYPDETFALVESIDTRLTERRMANPQRKDRA